MWTTVGVPRFELGTSRTRTVRSTGLSHTPNSVADYNFRTFIWQARVKNPNHKEKDLKDFLHERCVPGV